MYPTLKFANPVFRQGLQQTIRIIPKHEPQPHRGDVFTIQNKTGRYLGAGFVVMVEEYALKDLPDNIIGMSHDPRTQKVGVLVCDLMKYYDNIDGKTVVTVIWFELLSRGELGAMMEHEKKR